VKSKNEESTKTGDESDKQQELPVKELPRKKTGRPLLLGAELDAQVQEYIKDLKRRGLSANTAVVIGSARGILMYKDANLLADNEKGAEIDLSKDWAKYLLKQMGYIGFSVRCQKHSCYG